MRRLLVPCALFASLVACSHDGSSTIPAAGNSPQQLARVKAKLVIKVPRRKAGHGKRPRYISPATASLKYQVAGQAAVTVALTTSNPECTNGSTGLLCTLSIDVLPGKDAITFTALDSGGDALSANTIVRKIVAGASNRIAVTLGGIASSIGVTPVSAPQVTGTQASPGYSYYGTVPAKFAIVALDAAGDSIIGAGAPTVIQGTPAPSHLSVATPNPATPTSWTLTSTYTTASDPGVPSVTTLTVRATPVPGSGGSTVSASVKFSLYHPWLYVTSTPANSVAAFDEQGNAESPSGGFSSVDGPQGIAYDPDNGFIYIADNAGATITAYDREGAAQTLTGSFSGLSQPTNVAYDAHNQTLYVADNSNVFAFDPEGNSVTLTGNGGSPFPNVNGAQTVVVDPNNNWLYVSNYNTNSVTVYDEEGDQELTTGSPFSGLTDPKGLALDSANDLLYVSNGDSTSPVLVFDENGNSQTVTGTWSGAGTPVFITYDPHNGFLYFDNNNNSVTAYDAQGDEQTLSSPITGTGQGALVVLP